MKNLLTKIFENTKTLHLENKIAICSYDIQLNYGEFTNLIKKTTRLLKSQSISKGDRVIIALGNSIEQIIMHYAVILSGAISVPLPQDLAQDRIIFFIKNVDATATFLRKGIDWDNCVIVEDFEKFYSTLKSFEEEVIFDEVSAEDIIAIMYTSGSTGIPKGVCLTHKCVNQALKNIMPYVGYDGNNREIVTLPIYHSFGLGHVYCTHLSGGTVFIQDGIKLPKKFFKALEDDYNGMPLTPSMLKVLLDRYREKAIPLLNTLDYIVVNSEPLPVEIIKDLRANCPNLKIMSYYGLTEASRSTFITFSDEDEIYFKSVGRPTSSDVNLKIIDNEICISGNHLFDGYWNNILDNNIKDGWFRTGDLGYIDDNGYLFITGRKNDLINVGGLKVSALEIIKCIDKIDGVEDVSVVAIVDVVLGEVPGAMVVGDIEADEIIDHCRKYLENFAVPRKIIFRKVIPKSENGKIMLGEVKRIITKEIQK